MINEMQDVSSSQLNVSFNELEDAISEQEEERIQPRHSTPLPHEARLSRKQIVLKPKIQN